MQPGSARRTDRTIAYSGAFSPLNKYSVKMASRNSSAAAAASGHGGDDEDIIDFSYAKLTNLINSSKQIRSEEAVFNTIQQWTQKDKKGRMGHLFGLLKLVNLEKLMDSSKESFDTVRTAFREGIFKECGKCTSHYWNMLADKVSENKWGQAGQGQPGRVNEANDGQRAGPSSQCRPSNIDPCFSVVENDQLPPASGQRPAKGGKSASPTPRKSARKSTPRKSAEPSTPTESRRVGALRKPASGARKPTPTPGSGSTQRKSLATYAARASAPASAPKRPATSRAPGPSQKSKRVGATRKSSPVSPEKKEPAARRPAPPHSGSGTDSESEDMPNNSATAASKLGPSRIASSTKSKMKRLATVIELDGPRGKRQRSSTPSSNGREDPEAKSDHAIIYAIFQNEKKYIRTYDFETNAITTRTVHEMNPPRRMSTLVYYNDQAQIFDIGGTTDCDPRKADGETRPSNDVSVFQQGLTLHTAVLKMKEARRDAQTCICNQYLYAIGGCQLDKGRVDSAMNCVERLNLGRRVSNKWDEMPGLLYLRGAHSACVLEGKIFVTGGIGVRSGTDDVAVHTATVECFDPPMKTWSEMTPMLQARAYHKVVVVNGKIYAVGGSIERAGVKNLLNSVEVFNPDEKTWTPCPAMEKPRERFLLIARRNRIYAIGGDSKENPSMEVYDLDEGEWSLIDWPVGLPKNADFDSAIPY